jgi:ArsR family transcriptional regulator, arsenate/arsenite/antimonite-responsive transcriptional repressor
VRAVDSCPPAAPGPARVASEDLEACAKLLKALSDPTRLEIVALVAKASEPLCACEIEGHFSLSQSTISHHLGQLRNAGVLASERRGTWAFYSIEDRAAAGLDPVLRLLQAK